MYSKVKILIIDDNIPTLKLEEEILKKSGFNTISANDGFTAIEAIKEDPKINLILMDLDLKSEMDGAKTAAEILKLREIPIIFLTNHTERTSVEKVKNIPHYGYVLKSGGYFVLMEAVKVALDLFESHKKIRESEEKYRSLFENMQEGFAYCKMIFNEENEPVDFVYLDVNSKFEQITGLKNVIGRKVSEVIPGIKQNDDELFKVYAKVALTGNPEKFEYFLKSLSLWFSLSVFSPEKEYFVAIFDVITERKGLEKEREAMIELLNITNKSKTKRELIHLTTTFIKNWLKCDAVGIRLKEGDDFPYYETLGFSDDFVESERFLCSYDINGSIERDNLGNPILACMCGNIICGRFDPEKPFFTKHGSFWSNCTTNLLASTTEADRQSRTRNRCNGEGYESVGLFPIKYIDKTIGLLQVNNHNKNLFSERILSVLERFGDTLAIALTQQMTNEALKKSEEKYRNIIEQSSDGIAIIDDRGNYLDVNISLCNMLGYTRDEFLSMNIKDFSPEDEYELQNEQIARLLRGENVTIERHLRKKNNTYLLIEANGKRISDGNILGIYRDITERKKSELERMRLQNLEALSLLAGGIAHDFNNILSAILGRANLALEEIQDLETRDDISAIDKAAKRAAGLTQQLLTFAKGGKPQKSVIDLKRIIQDTTRFSLSGSNVIASFDFKETHGLEADPGQISQVIQNLVINAKQAMPDGGQISISSCDHEDPNKKQFVKIIVRDTGFGIPEDIIEKIFNPYFTTKETGSGLGLSVTHSIITSHDGKIYVQSEPGIGTTFTILLPASKSEPMILNENKKSLMRELNILIMDDDEEIRSSLSIMLKKSGHTVKSAREGNEAIKYYKEAQESGKPFDLVFMDLTIRGGLGGRDTLKILKEYNPKIKSVVSSGYSDSSLSNYKKDGFSAMLPKPYSRNDLAKAISDALGE
jgi:two-component system, cell cycle sensor histidine kinase and response regulator CckA